MQSTLRGALVGLAALATHVQSGDTSKYRRWGADPKLVDPCEPNCNDIIGVEVHRTTEVPLTNPRFDDDHLFQCPKSMIKTWTANNAIDGQKYCMSKAECDSPFRLAHSKRTNATFTADFALSSDKNTVEIGRVLWWPREDCCQGQNKKLVVKINNQQCFPVTEYMDGLPTTGLDPVQVAVRTGRSEIRPMVFKCPPGTKGDKVTVWNPDYFVMITEIEVWTRDTGVLHSQKAGLENGLSKVEFTDEDTVRLYYDYKKAKPAVDGDLDTYVSRLEYSSSKYIQIDYDRTIAPKEVHVWPRQDGDFGMFSPTSYSPLGLEVLAGGYKCKTDVVLGDVNNSCRYWWCKDNQKSCEKWMCRTAEDVVKAHVAAGKPIVYTCPADAKTRWVKLRRNNGLAVAEIEVYA